MEDPRTAYEISVDMDLGNNRGLVSFREKMPFRKRNREALEGVEHKGLASLDTERMQLFSNNKLKSWPHHFDTPEQCGEEMKKGLMLLWSSYLVVETLLAAVVIQPLTSIQGQMTSPNYKPFGLLWMVAFLCDSMGLAVTAVLISGLLAVSAGEAHVDLGYTVWTLYGPAIRISCLIVEVSGVGIGVLVYWYIRSLQEEEEPLHTPQPALQPKVRISLQPAEHTLPLETEQASECSS